MGPQATAVEDDAPAGVSAIAAIVSRHLGMARDSLVAAVELLDVDQLDGTDSVSLFVSVADVLRTATSLKLSLAAHIDATGTCHQAGHRNTASLVSQIEGVPLGAAGSTVATANRLRKCPATDQAMRQGRLSESQARAITDAAVAAPGSEAQLVDAATSTSADELAENCRRVKAGSANADPKATYKRIHESRSVKHWTDEEGALCLRGRFTPDIGAKMIASLERTTNELFEEARASGSQEPLHAYRADALAGLIVGERTAEHSGVDVIVRVDHEALVRGHAEGDEMAEIDGVGPLPVPKIVDLMSDAGVKVVFAHANDVSRIYHFTRTINASILTALIHRDPRCVVGGCGATRFLEIDHVVPFSEGGPTTLANLARLCSFHHSLKSNEGYVLWRDGDNQWHFDPPPPFGEEPGLGSRAIARASKRDNQPRPSMCRLE